MRGRTILSVVTIILVVVMWFLCINAMFPIDNDTPHVRTVTQEQVSVCDFLSPMSYEVEHFYIIPVAQFGSVVVLDIVVHTDNVLSLPGVTLSV